MKDSDLQFVRRSDGSIAITHGINVNDKSQPFTDQILSGEKTVETRNSKSLHPYVGRQMGIIRTGKGKAHLVGYATVGEPVHYEDEKSFDLDFEKHRVGKDSAHYIGKAKPKKGKPAPTTKWGYPFNNVSSITPVPVTSRGNVARKINNG